MRSSGRLRSRRAGRLRVLALVAVLASILGGTGARADTPANDAFERTWQRTDKPVADGAVQRTWMWGPRANTPAFSEPYAEGPAGVRTVQYFDKSRMEISTEPGVDSTSFWYVTNGLLIVEMVTGRLQVGDGSFEDRGPAWINVAGDEDDPLGPTYATFGSLLAAPPAAVGAPITTTVNRYGVVGDDPGLASLGATGAYRVSVTGIDHVVASPFWEFMQSVGTVWEDGTIQDGALFVNPFYATGYPISEAYWADVAVAGVREDVLIQCFERRCLTYTPGNPEGWKVEAGNVGRHYQAWRYDDWPGDPPRAGTSIYTTDLSDFAPFSGPSGAGGWNGSSYAIEAPGGDAGASVELFVHSTEGDYTPPAGGEVDSVRLRITSGGQETFACLVSRYAGDEQGSRRYALCIDGYDTVSAAWETFSPAGVTVEYQPLLEFTASDALASSNWTTLEIAAVGSQFWFLVNGDLVGTAAHPGASQGFAGLYLVNDGEAPASAEFKNLSVSAPAGR